MRLTCEVEMSDEPEVKVEVEVEPAAEPEPTAEVVVVPETGAVDDAIALVEHVEGDTDKWVENAVEHERVNQRLAALESREWAQPTREEVVAIVEEKVEEEIEPEPEPKDEAEIEIDVPAVEEVAEKRHGASWDVFEDIHGTR